MLSKQFSRLELPVRKFCHQGIQAALEPWRKPREFLVGVIHDLGSSGLASCWFSICRRSGVPISSQAPGW